MVRVRAKKSFREFFKGKPLLTIKRYHIEDYFIWRRDNPLTERIKTVSNATINREISYLSHFFNYCIERDYYQRNNPAQRIKKDEDNIRRIKLTIEQTTELLNEAYKHTKLYAAVLLGLLGGLRQKEVLGLSWENVNFENSLIHARERTTKGRKSRIVHIPENLKEYLIELRKMEPHTDLLFHEYKGKSWLQSAFRRLRERLSFKHVLDVESGKKHRLKYHDLRHIYAGVLYDKGVSLNDIKELLGHSSVRITERRYANASKDVDPKVVESLNKIIPLPVKKAV
ncbi:tyrosine-type recombinase/integrase [Spirochaetota bacterium]